MRLMERAQQVGKLAVTPSGNGEYEFQRLTTLPPDSAQCLEVVERQKPPVGDQPPLGESTEVVSERS